MPTAAPEASPAAVDSTSPAPSVPAKTAPADRPPVQSAEQRGWVYARKLHDYITKNKGKFLKDDTGELSVFIDGKTVPLNPITASDTDALNGLLLKAADITSVTQEARIAIQRLRVIASDSCSNIHERYFSACSEDEKRIYIPVAGEMLLEISAASIKTVPNVMNEAGLWIKHPENAPFKYTSDDPREGLAAFERLTVDTLACEHDEMRWLVAMDEALFPYVRDLATTRLITTHEGQSTHGKTSAAQRFTLLHGLGEVTGDATIAALTNSKDRGLLVLDNKEQKNLNQPLIDYLLFLSTGARRERSSKDGAETRATNTFRPVGVVTSIEGICTKTELANRNVTVKFCITGTRINREENEREIKKLRRLINSALAVVLQRFLRIRNQHENPNPFNGNYASHWGVLCDLLRAFGEVADKSEGWAEKIIAAWNRLIVGQREGAQDSESKYEYPIQKILYACPHSSLDVQQKATEIRGRKGTLFVLQAGYLLDQLKREPGMLASLPETPAAFGNRLDAEAERFQTLELIRWKEREWKDNPPEHLKHLKDDLKRTNSGRRLGFFIPSDKGDKP